MTADRVPTPDEIRAALATLGAIEVAPGQWVTRPLSDRRRRSVRAPGGAAAGKTSRSLGDTAAYVIGWLIGAAAALAALIAVPVVVAVFLTRLTTGCEVPLW